VDTGTALVRTPAKEEIRRYEGTGRDGATMNEVPRIRLDTVEGAGVDFERRSR
jgi:hypothetical protein